MLYGRRITGLVPGVAGACLLLICCSPEKKAEVTMEEVQLTRHSYGHMLNSLQVFSPDDQWIVYDTRNDQTHIGRTCCLEKVNVNTGEVVKLYSAPGQTLHGPGVGAPAWHPTEPKVVFIHGLLNCDESKPYGFTRRFGALLDETTGQVVAADARATDVLVPGALRGGTHAHSWSGDGKWMAFTYNDVLMEKLEASSNGKVRDLRTIGVMSPAASVSVANESGENFSGQYFTAVAATVVDNPTPGSDEVEKAFDECWVGTNGYTRKDGSRQTRAIAFQGHVRDASGQLVTEVFVSDIPDDITLAGDAPLEGTPSTRPNVPRGLNQRRITHTTDRKFPGVQGPRCWLRSSPDGSTIYFLMKDDNEVVQVYSASVLGDDLRQVTNLPVSVQGQFNVSPDGLHLALIADNSIWIHDLAAADAKRLTARSDDAQAPLSAVVWNKAGTLLAYNRFVEDGSGNWLQIFTLRVN